MGIPYTYPGVVSGLASYMLLNPGPREGRALAAATSRSLQTVRASLHEMVDRGHAVRSVRAPEAPRAPCPMCGVVEHQTPQRGAVPFLYELTPAYAATLRAASAVVGVALPLLTPSRKTGEPCQWCGAVEKCLCEA